MVVFLCTFVFAVKSKFFLLQSWPCCESKNKVTAFLSFFPQKFPRIKRFSLQFTRWYLYSTKSQQQSPQTVLCCKVKTPLIWRQWEGKNPFSMWNETKSVQSRGKHGNPSNHIFNSQIQKPETWSVSLYLQATLTLQKMPHYALQQIHFILLTHSEMADGWHAHALTLVISLLNLLGSNYFWGEQKPAPGSYYWHGSLMNNTASFSIRPICTANLTTPCLIKENV